MGQGLSVGAEHLVVGAAESLDLLLLLGLDALLGVLGSLLLPDAGALGLVEDQAGRAGKLVGDAVHAVVEPECVEQQC